MEEVEFEDGAGADLQAVNARSKERAKAAGFMVGGYRSLLAPSYRLPACRCRMVLVSNTSRAWMGHPAIKS